MPQLALEMSHNYLKCTTSNISRKQFSFHQADVFRSLKVITHPFRQKGIGQNHTWRGGSLLGIWMNYFPHEKDVLPLLRACLGESPQARKELIRKWYHTSLLAGYDSNNDTTTERRLSLYNEASFVASHG